MINLEQMNFPERKEFFNSNGINLVSDEFIGGRYCFVGTGSSLDLSGAIKDAIYEMDMIKLNTPLDGYSCTPAQNYSQWYSEFKEKWIK